MELTLKEAKYQGYTMAGRHRNQWQVLTPIEDMSEIDFKDEIWHLAEKEGYPYLVDKHFVSETLADVIASNEAFDSGRDDDAIYNAIMEIDFSETVETLNKVLENYKTWRLTDIKLLP